MNNNQLREALKDLLAAQLLESNTPAYKKAIEQARAALEATREYVVELEPGEWYGGYYHGSTGKLNLLVYHRDDALQMGKDSVDKCVEWLASKGFPNARIVAVD